MKYCQLLFLLCTIGSIIGCNQSIEKTNKKSTEEVEISKLKFVKTISITGNTLLAFAKIDTVFNLYQEPYLVIGKKEYRIKGFSNLNSSSDEIVALSPDGRYFVMDSISIGYVEGENGEKKLHDNYFCVVVDIFQKSVIHQMQSDCGGEWNAQGQWISNGQVILSLD